MTVVDVGCRGLTGEDNSLSLVLTSFKADGSESIMRRRRLAAGSSGLSRVGRVYSHESLPLVHLEQGRFPSHCRCQPRLAEHVELARRVESRDILLEA